MYKILGADQKEYGPVTADQLKRWIAEGRANGQTRVQVEGATDWRPLSSFPEFAEALGLGGSVPPLTGTAPLPAAGPLPGMRPNIPNYLVPAILTTICCCLPLGIPAIVFAAQVNTKLAANDYAGAQEASDKAKMWCWIAFAAGAIITVIYGLLGVFGGLNGFPSYRR